jgi:hypothetical protein
MIYRRNVIKAAALGIFAPFIARADSLMPIKVIDWDKVHPMSKFARDHGSFEICTFDGREARPLILGAYKNNAPIGRRWHERMFFGMDGIAYSTQLDAKIADAEFVKKIRSKLNA